jgi:hypothetical protein
VATSAEAGQLEKILESAPKQIDLPLPKKREAGEHAEDLASEPENVAYEDAPEVKGLWARPAGAQHVFPLYAGFLPEADAAIAMIGGWIDARLRPPSPPAVQRRQP